MGYDLKKKVKHINDWNYSKELKMLVKYIKKHWDISAKPKEYDEFIKNYKDFQGMDEQDEDKICNRFEGHLEGGAGSLNFPLRISTPHTAYEHKGQSCPPLETLLGAVMAYGMFAGQRLEQVNSNSDSNYRLRYIDHLNHSKTYTKDEYLVFLFDKEKSEVLSNLGRPLKEIREEFEGKRAEYLIGGLKKIKEYMSKKNVKSISLKPDSKDKTCVMFFELTLELSYIYSSNEKIIQIFNDLGYDIKFLNYYINKGIRLKLKG